MLLLEHNGKALLREHGIPTSTGKLARDAAELAAALNAMPARLVLKAQIPAGGRGKGGGIAFAESPREALEAFAAMKERIVNGHAVDCVLVEERVDIVRESYAGITIDGGDICLLFAREGGVDIEELAAADPSSFQAIRVDPLKGPDAGQLQDCFERLDYASAYRVAYEDVARRLFAMFGACDATMIEINPLAELGECRLLALDARVVIDDCALARQPLIGAMQPMLIPAGHAPGNLPTLRIKENPEGGSIGLIGLGGGLNVTLMDWIAASGAGVAALVDIDEAIGSSHAEDGFAAALDACERNPAIKSILVNVITCGYRLDDIVADLVRALDGGRTARTKPVILHLRGNSMARTPAILAATRWENCPSLAAAVAATIAAAKA